MEMTSRFNQKERQPRPQTVTVDMPMRNPQAKPNRTVTSMLVSSKLIPIFFSNCTLLTLAIPDTAWVKVNQREVVNHVVSDPETTTSL